MYIHAYMNIYLYVYTHTHTPTHTHTHAYPNHTYLGANPADVHEVCAELPWDMT